MAIVIVDDTIFSLEVIKAFLLTAGYSDVITLKSAKELYQLVDGYSDRGILVIDLILLYFYFFKTFNDTYGHIKGDDCLKTVAATLKKTLKRPGDFPARYGGEEFAVVLPNTDEVGAAIIAEELRSSIEGVGIAHVNSLCADYVTVSLGVVTRLSEQVETPDDLILAADRALYRSKHEGRNRVSVERLM